MNQPASQTNQSAGPGTAVTGVILAGGRGQRMAGIDKGLVEIGGRPLLATIAAVLAPQVAHLLISANRNRTEYQRYGYTVIRDAIDGFAGPLAGILSAMDHCKTELVLTVPCDAPLLGTDYCARMLSALREAGTDACVAHDGEQIQPMYALLHRKHRDSLRQFLDAGHHKVHDWLSSLTVAHADFSDHPEQFYNMNTPADKMVLEKLLR